MNNAPIGVFDSGLGGLTVVRSLIDTLPHESLVYLGDTAHTPYGSRTVAEARELTLAGLDALVELGAKMLVIACNTATATTIADAQERYWGQLGIPVVEVIIPAARKAAIESKGGRIGVIATEATVNSDAYGRALNCAAHVQLMQQACPRFVELVEAGLVEGPEVEEACKEYLTPLAQAEVDTVILGCTHYPLLAEAIGRTLGSRVNLVSSSHACAQEVTRRLEELHLEASTTNEANYKFYATSQDPRFEKLAQRFLGAEVDKILPLQ